MPQKIEKRNCPRCGEKNIIAHDWEVVTRTGGGSKSFEIWYYYMCPICDLEWSIQKIR